MRKLFLLAILSLSFAALAQSIDKNLQGANTDANKLDPASKARVRTEGSAGGTGARIPDEARGGAEVGEGSQHRHSPTTKDSAAGGSTRRPDEKSGKRGQ